MEQEQEVSPRTLLNEIQDIRFTIVQLAHGLRWPYNSLKARLKSKDPGDDLKRALYLALQAHIKDVERVCKLLYTPQKVEEHGRAPNSGSNIF